MPGCRRLGPNTVARFVSVILFSAELAPTLCVHEEEGGGGGGGGSKEERESEGGGE